MVVREPRVEGRRICQEGEAGGCYAARVMAEGCFQSEALELKS